MKYTILVRGAAERDISQAQDWYQQEAGLAVEFHQELSATLHILSDTPFIYPKLYGDIRRACLHRFPYLIWYRVQRQKITVLACTHVRRGPGKLSQKLR